MTFSFQGVKSEMIKETGQDGENRQMQRVLFFKKTQ